MYEERYVESTCLINKKGSFFLRDLELQVPIQGEPRKK